MNNNVHEVQHQIKMSGIKDKLFGEIKCGASSNNYVAVVMNNCSSVQEQLQMWL
jgi:hypothetical protein